MATLLLSNAPLSDRDVATLREASDRFAFEVLLLPVPPVADQHGDPVGHRV